MTSSTLASPPKCGNLNTTDKICPKDSASQVSTTSSTRRAVLKEFNKNATIKKSHIRKISKNTNKNDGSM